MKKINYKSDFDFILKLRDCRGEALGWPRWDWSARFWTTQKVIAFEVGCRDGVAVNCYDDGGEIHVVMNDHRLGAGVLNVEFTAEIPNGIYPDDAERIVVPLPLEIELIRAAAPCPEGFEVEVVLPVIKGKDAYESAVEAGYAGTAEELSAALAAVPGLAERLEPGTEGFRELAEAVGGVLDVREVEEPIRTGERRLATMLLTQAGGSKPGYKNVPLVYSALYRTPGVGAASSAAEIRTGDDAVVGRLHLGCVKTDGLDVLGITGTDGSSVIRLSTTTSDSYPPPRILTVMTDDALVSVKWMQKWINNKQGFVTLDVKGKLDPGVLPVADYSGQECVTVVCNPREGYKLGVPVSWVPTAAQLTDGVTGEGGSALSAFVIPAPAGDQYPGSVQVRLSGRVHDGSRDPEPGSGSIVLESGLARVVADVEAHRRDLFIDLWEATFPLTSWIGYNRETGLFFIKPKFFGLDFGLDDITYEEALVIYNRATSSRSLSEPFNLTRMRINLPPYTEYEPKYTPSCKFVRYSNYMEWLVLATSTDGLRVTGYEWILDCPKLAGVYGMLSDTNTALTTCPALKYVHAKAYSGGKIEIPDSPLLAIESLRATVDGCGSTLSKPCSYVVHADVYAKLTDEENAEWHQVMVDAAEKNIQFATR